MVPTPLGPVRAGTTTEEHMRVAGGAIPQPSASSPAVGPGLRFAWRTTSGADADGSRTVTATAAGACVVRLELNVRLHGAQRLAAPLFRATLRRALTGDAGRLRALVETARLLHLVDQVGDRVDDPRRPVRVALDVGRGR